MIQTCVSCGKEYSGSNHHCSPRHESARKGAQTRALNAETFLAYEAYRPNQTTRLVAGLQMLEVTHAD